MAICKICGDENCKKHSFMIGKAKPITEFSGSSPPEIFVGRWNYPNVYTGILAPQEYGDKQILSSPELWHKNKLSISDILAFRNKLIYGRKQSHIRKQDSKLKPVLQEVAMAHKSIAAEFKLKKPITAHKENEKSVPLISNAAEIEKVRLQENPAVKPKVDYLVNDTDVKSTIAMQELYKSGIGNEFIVKLLSAGLLGMQANRKMVPTRWSITAVDDSLSKEKLKKIKFMKQLQEFQVFNAEYVGNHYEFLLLPSNFEFEVIEIAISNMMAWQDYESFQGRKKYAESVTGAYYANRLALTEYLERIQRQCSCLVIRQVSQEYYAPLGVGILRQTSREAFSKKPESFQSLNEALNNIQSRLRINISNYTGKSKLLANYGKQSRLNQFF